MINQRPTGVTILAVLQIVGGILSLLYGISSLFFGGAMIAVGEAEPSATVLGPMMAGVGMVAIISGIIGLIAGYGLFTLKGWGWALAIVFSILNVIRNLISLVQGADVPAAIIGIVISGLILYYLYRPQVKRAFGKA